jgi:hypothetical protein
VEKRSTLSKILAIVGTILVWIPILAPIGFGFVSLGMDGIYRFDFLMPAELGVVVFVGGALVLWAAISAKSKQVIIAWGLGIAAGSIAILSALGDVEPGSLKWAIAIGLLAAYSLALLVLGVGGVLLWRDLSKK